MFKVARAAMKVAPIATVCVQVLPDASRNNLSVLIPAAKVKQWRKEREICQMLIALKNVAITVFVTDKILKTVRTMMAKTEMLDSAGNRPLKQQRDWNTILLHHLTTTTRWNRVQLTKPNLERIQKIIHPILNFLFNFIIPNYLKVNQALFSWKMMKSLNF